MDSPQNKTQQTLAPFEANVIISSKVINIKKYI